MKTTFTKNITLQLNMQPCKIFNYLNVPNCSLPWLISPQKTMKYAMETNQIHGKIFNTFVYPSTDSNRFCTKYHVKVAKILIKELISNLLILVQMFT